MLMKGKEGQFIKWKREQSKKVDSIQNDRIDALKNRNVGKVTELGPEEQKSFILYSLRPKI